MSLHTEVETKWMTFCRWHRNKCILLNENFREVIFKLITVTCWGISWKIALRWMPLDLTDDKSTLVQVMAWCRQATSHYLSQCWPRSQAPYGILRPQRVNENCLLSAESGWQYRSRYDVVSSAQFCSDHMIRMWMMTKHNFHIILIMTENMLVK